MHGTRTQLAMRGSSALGHRKSTGGCGARVTPSATPLREPPPAQGGKQILGKAEAGALLDSSYGPPCDHATQVPTVLHEKVKVPQVQFVDRLSNFQSRHREWYSQTVCGLVLDVLVVMQRRPGGLNKVMMILRRGFSPFFFLLHFSHSVHLDVECQLSAEFWGALDGQQLLVVEGPGTPGVRLPGVLPQVN